jgi:OOP family OmpA-OmpF porin
VTNRASESNSTENCIAARARVNFERACRKAIMAICGAFSSLFSNLEKCAGKIILLAAFAAAIATIAPAVFAAPQEVEMNVQLTGLFTLGTAHEGEIVTARVLSPDSFKGDPIKGRVTQVATVKGQQLVQFQFDTIHHGDYDYAVMANIQAIANSTGKPGVDEQGRPLRTSMIPGKAKKPSKFSGGLSGIIEANPADRTNGPAPPTPPPSIQVVVPGADSELADGSTMKLSVRSNGGGDLTGLYPNTPDVDELPPPPPKPAAPASSAPANVKPAASAAQPDLKTATNEFIPGERTIFFDDFSDMSSGQKPPRWNLRAGTVELLTVDNVQELNAMESAALATPILSVPANFTFEVEWKGSGEMDWNFRNGSTAVLTAVIHGEANGSVASVKIAGANGATLGSGQIAADTARPTDFSLSVQSGQITAYVNGQRIVDINRAALAAINHIDVVYAKIRPIALRRVRVAEAAPDFSAAISAAGTYVSHGIKFDSDSDRLKPESAPVLKQIAAELAKNPKLNLEINGYTDSLGDANHNLDLSKRRAQAVVSVLVTQFGIDASRLAAHGYGGARSMWSDETPDGRAENRRVEFVKK